MTDGATSLHPILDAIDEPAFAIGADGTILDANAAAAAATGAADAAALCGHALDALLGPLEDRDADVASSWLDETVERRPGTLRRQGRTAEESQRVEVTVAPLACSGAAAVVVAALLGPLTREQERDRALRQLSEAEALAGLGSWEWDVSTNEVRWSEEMCRLVGIDPEEAEPSYERYMALVHPDDRDRWLADLDDLFHSSEAFVTEHRIVRPDGSVRHVRARAQVVRDDDGAPLRLLGSALDVTEQHELARRKDEFVSVVSHELRTPLTSISGALGLLAGGTAGDLPPRVARMIEIASTNAARLVRLINDILDLERIDSGRAEMAYEDLDVDHVVAEAVATMEAMATEAGVRLETDVEGAVRLVGDADRLQQVLTNLLSNAIKYSPPGEAVTVAARQDDGEVVVRVTDRGRGIPADDAQRIFGRFEQVDSTDAREKGGTGLGLAICRSIVDEHGGVIWADSEPGAGTAVVVRLPIGPLLGDPGPDGGPLVLVCDDEVDARAIARATLEASGYRVIIARDGDEALRRATEEQPAAIVLDLVMPGRDGWQTASALRRNPATADIPVVIFSGLAAEDTSVEANVSSWVDKAMVEADLVGAVDRVVDSPDGHAEEGARLLLVEDDPDLANVLAQAFRGHGVAVWVARDGREAERLCRSVEPHALVLDLLLPDRDGFAVVAAMRQQERLQRTPLVVYSALDLDAQQRAELRLGPTEYYTKGRVSPHQLQERVLDLLRGVAP